MSHNALFDRQYRTYSFYSNNETSPKMTAAPPNPIPIVRNTYQCLAYNEAFDTAETYMSDVQYPECGDHNGRDITRGWGPFVADRQHRAETTEYLAATLYH